MYRVKTRKSTQSRDTLCSFWNSLQLLGINVLKDNNTKKESLQMKSYKLFMIFVMLLSLVVMLIVMLTIPYNIYTVSLIIQIVAVQFMYFNILMSTSKLSTVRKLLNLFPLCKKRNPCIIFMYVLTRLSILILVFHPFYEYFTGFEAFLRYKIYFNPWFSIIYLISCNLLVTVAPIILTSFSCVICYQWKEIIICVKRDLQNARICFIDFNQMRVARNLLQNVRILWYGTNVIKYTLSKFLFYMIVKSVSVIFLMWFLVIKRLELVFISAIIFFLGIELFYFINTVYLASGIPEEMDDLLMILNEIYEEMSLKENGKKFKFIQKEVKLVINKKSIVLTAGGWADMRKSLILTVFGNLVTYGLIIKQYDPLE